MTKTTVRELMRYIDQFKNSVEGEVIAEKLTPNLKPGQTLDLATAAICWAAAFDMPPLRPNLKLVVDNDPDRDPSA